VTDPTPAPAPQGNPNPDPTPTSASASAPVLAPTPDPAPVTLPTLPLDPVASSEKWRESYATKKATVDGKLDQAAHDKLLNRLKRFSSIDDALEWGFNADKKIADGSYKKPLGDKATPDEIAEYRKANGIPETADKYLEKLPDGLVIGDDDKPFIEKFTKAFHDKNADPSIVHAAIKTYYDVIDQQEGLRQQLNAAARTETEDALRAEWGPDYRQNTNLINSFIGSMPKELQDELFQSAKPDGTQIMNNPAMLQWLAQQARELNYTGAVLPSGEASAKGIDSEIHELTKASGDKNGPYWKGPPHSTRKGETEMSGRLLELYELQQRLGARKAG
jgi:hypothetical protein